MIDSIREFLRLESASAILLLIAAILALVAANTPLSSLYDTLLQIPLAVKAGNFSIDKPLLLWINDGLMAIFFFLVGLELKREVMEGELSRPEQIVLPGVAALGGIIVPSLVYLAVNTGDPVAMKGWAIPSATDIAFALGVLSALGPRVPLSLKLFLMTLAVIDDLGAIVIIALFYTNDLSVTSLVVAGCILTVMAILKLRRVDSAAAYLLLGIALWAAVLKSGVHATLAGVLAAFFIPLRTRNPEEPSPLRALEHDLHPTVSFAILPLFAFANAGVHLGGVGLASLLEPVPLGIMLGLFVGKQLGVFSFTWVMIRLGWAKMPQGATWGMIWGVALLCGVGFTMSLFIGSLAFEQGGPDYAFNDRLGILAGSVISAAAGYLVLLKSRARMPETPS